MASRQLPSKFRKVTISFMIGSVWHDLTKGKAGTGTKFRKSSEIRASPRFGLRGLGFRQQSDGGDVADGGQRDDETDQHRAMVGDQSHQWGQNSAAYDGGDHQAGKLVGVLRQGSAIQIAPIRSGTAKYAAYFGDIHGNVYAVDAANGELLWKHAVDPHPLSRITAGVRIYNGRFYVPVASLEEPESSSYNYHCCSFRGMVAALNADTDRKSVV